MAGGRRRSDEFETKRYTARGPETRKYSISSFVRVAVGFKAIYEN